jgi:hypothetical protein
MNKEHWQNAIDELLEGSLAAADASALRQEAEHDAQLARAIIDAYLIQSELESLGLEAAPPALKKRLRAIPARQQRQPGPLLRWGAVAASLAVIALTMSALRGPRPPSSAEIAQAQAELAVAFTYLNAIGRKAGFEMRQEIGDTMKDALIDGVREGVSNKQETS